MHERPPQKVVGILQDFLNGAATSEKIQDQGHPNSRTLDTGLSVADVVLDGDHLFPVCLCPHNPPLYAMPRINDYMMPAGFDWAGYSLQ